MHNREIHVVAGIIQDLSKQILIAKRQSHQHQGGLWEFPGGKKEAEENAETALKRELWEELGIQVQACHPAISIRHRYPDKAIFLDVWWVTAWQQQPYSKEGQRLRWVNAAQITSYAFPIANLPILQALRLPAYYQISIANPPALAPFLQQLQQQLQQGLQLYQLRLADVALYPQYFQAVYRLCQQYNCQLMLNSGALAVLNHIPSNVGIHFRVREWTQLKQRPCHHLCAASCHNPVEIQQAVALKMDFITLSPIKATQSHLDATPLGWQQCWQGAQLAKCPMYALGGMTAVQLNCARAHGAQGIAGIRGLQHNSQIVGEWF